jgi:hypothetical protein
MKPILMALLLILTLGSAAQKLNPVYDSTLAKRLGADEYGMKKYLIKDPAIASHFLEPELYEWYGSAALPEYLPADKIIQKYHLQTGKEAAA